MSISRLAEYKALEVDVDAELGPIRVCGFVTHHSIEPTKEWRLEIARTLRSAEALVRLASCAASRWTQQEIGCSLGRGISVMSREGPRGFQASLVGSKSARLGCMAHFIIDRIISKSHPSAEPQGRGGQHSGHTAERIFTSVHRAPRCYR